MKSDASKKRNILLITLGIFVITSVLITFLILDWRVVEVDLSGGQVDVDGEKVVAIDSLVLTYEHFGKVVEAIAMEAEWTRKVGELLDDYDPVLHVVLGPGVPFAIVCRIYEAAGAAGIDKVRFNHEDEKVSLENPFAVLLEPLPEIEEDEPEDDEAVVKDGPPRLSDEEREKRKAAARARAEARMKTALYLHEGYEFEDSSLEFVVTDEVVLLKAGSAIFSEGDSMTIGLEIGDDEVLAQQLSEKLAPAVTLLKAKITGRPETVRISAAPAIPAGRVLTIIKTVGSILDAHYGVDDPGENEDPSFVRAVLSEAEIIRVSDSGLTYLNEDYGMPRENLLILTLNERLESRQGEARDLEEWYGVEFRPVPVVVCEADARYSGVFAALYHFTKIGYYDADLVGPGGMAVSGLFERKTVDKAVSQDILLDPKTLSVEPAVIKTLSLAYFGEEPDWEKTFIPSKAVRVEFDQTKGYYDGFRQVMADVQVRLGRSKYASEPYRATIFCGEGVPVGSLLKVMLEIRVEATRFGKHDTLIPSVIRRRPQILLALGDRNAKKSYGAPLKPIN